VSGAGSCQHVWRSCVSEIEPHASFYCTRCGRHGGRGRGGGDGGVASSMRGSRRPCLHRGAAGLAFAPSTATASSTVASACWYRSCGSSCAHSRSRRSRGVRHRGRWLRWLWRLLRLHPCASTNGGTGRGRDRRLPMRGTRVVVDVEDSALCIFPRFPARRQLGDRAARGTCSPPRPPSCCGRVCGRGCCLQHVGRTVLLRLQHASLCRWRLQSPWCTQHVRCCRCCRCLGRSTVQWVCGHCMRAGLAAWSGCRQNGGSRPAGAQGCGWSWGVAGACSRGNHGSVGRRRLTARCLLRRRRPRRRRRLCCRSVWRLCLGRMRRWYLSLW